MHNNNSSFESNFKKAIYRLEKEELDDLYKEAAENPHVFSEKFERKMNWTLSHSGKSYFSMINTAAKRVAIATITVFTLLIITTFSVDALRESVIEFITQVFHEFTNIVFQIDNEAKALPETIETTFSPTYLPEGYELNEELTFEDSIKITYQNEIQNDLIFKQYTIEATKLGVDTEDGRAEDVLIGKYEAKYFSNKGIQQLIWTDGYYGYHILGPISKDEIILMAESIK